MAGDTNRTRDVFVRDRQSGTTERVSVDSVGIEANANSLDAAVSADGRFVALQSGTSNLVADDAHGRRELFVHDHATASTTPMVRPAVAGRRLVVYSS